nr:hypothetical protein [Tanacetum cinerariifolium]
MMDIGTLCWETISFMYYHVRVSLLYVARVGMKCAYLATNIVSLDPDTSCQNLVLRLELHKASALVVEKLTLDLYPRYISCFSRCSGRCPILNCCNLGTVNMKSLIINYVICMLFLITRVDENIIDEHYHKCIQIVPALLKELIYKVHGLLVPLLELIQFGILLGKLGVGQVALQEKLPEFSNYWPSILLLTVIIVMVAIVVVVLLVIVDTIIRIVVIIGAPSIIKLAFVITGFEAVTIPSILWGNLPIKISDMASSIRVPVADVTLFSSAQLLRENTDSVCLNQRMSPTAPSVPLK